MVMEGCRDFLEWLSPDTSTIVLMLLDPADLARVGAVSRSWRRFVVANGFSKRFCLKLYPEASHFTHVTICDSSRTADVGSSNAVEWQNLEREHRVYAYLGHLLTSGEANRDCISQPICASSTDNFPEESILNTLDSSELVDDRPSYWSSGGQADRRIPESLTYHLKANLCIVEEIKIQPFKAFFQYDHPIYSAKSVRFRMGYSKLTLSTENYAFDDDEAFLAAEENYKWTYISPEFPMEQVNALQSFKLPHPVVCIGGILQIQLMGRVQKQAMDGLYYICVCHVQVIGRPLPASLDVDILRGPGNIGLKYFPGRRECTAQPEIAEPDSGDTSPWHSFASRLIHMGANSGILGALFRPIHLSNSDLEDDEDEDDDIQSEPSAP